MAISLVCCGFRVWSSLCDGPLVLHKEGLTGVGAAAENQQAPAPSIFLALCDMTGHTLSVMVEEGCSTGSGRSVTGQDECWMTRAVIEDEGSSGGENGRIRSGSIESGL